MDVFKNLAFAQVSQGYDDTATSITLSTGHGARMPTAPFTLLWWNFTDYPNPADDPNAEYIRVTAITDDTLTITRAQEGTSASTKNTAGKTYMVMQTVLASQLALLLEAASAFAVDNRVLVSDGTGRAVKASPVTIDGSGNMTGVQGLTADTGNIGNFRLTEGAAPATPPAGTVSVYAKTDGKVYIKDDTGTETDITTAGSGGGTSITAVDATGAPYTLILTDAGKIIHADADVTIPPNSSVAYPTGTVILVQRRGAGSVSIVPDTGVTLNSPNNATAISAQWDVIALRKDDTDTWSAFGELS